MKKLSILLSGLLLCGVGFTSCDKDQELPPIAYPEGGSAETIGSGEWDNPFSVWQVLAGVEMNSDQAGVWVTGYIVGYINTFDGDYAKLREKSAVFSASGAPNSNLMLASSPDENDWEKCIPVQLAYGTDGRDLSLQQHPDYLGREVTLYGTTGAKYLSVYGLRNCSAYNWGNLGIYIAPPTVFTKTTEMIDGAQYIFVADNRIAQNLAENRNYGYLFCDETSAGEFVESKLSNAFTFTREGNAWTIVDSFGRYLYMTGTFDSFNVADQPTDNYLWDVTFNENGEAVVTNVGNTKWIQYDKANNRFAAFNSDKGVLPALYVVTDTEE